MSKDRHTISSGATTTAINNNYCNDNSINIVNNDFKNNGVVTTHTYIHTRIPTHSHTHPAAEPIIASLGIAAEVEINSLTSPHLSPHL